MGQELEDMWLDWNFGEEHGHGNISNNNVREVIYDVTYEDVDAHFCIK